MADASLPTELNARLQPGDDRALATLFYLLCPNHFALALQPACLLHCLIATSLQRSWVETRRTYEAYLWGSSSI